MSDFDQYYFDMPGRYIDDVLRSDLPGSHMDNLLYGDLPGSHLDVILDAPLPGGSTDDFMSMPRAGIGPYGFGSNVTDNHGHSHGAGAAVGLKRESLEERRRHAEEERARKEFLNTLEQVSYKEANASQNRINKESQKGLDDLQTLWSSVRANVNQDWKERREKKQEKQRAQSRRISAGTPFSRAGNSSKFVRKEIRKERPKARVGIAGVFFIMIVLLTFVNRVMIPLVEHFSSDSNQNISESGDFYLTDAEFDTLVNINTDIVDAMDEEGYFELSDEEFVGMFEANGFKMTSNEEKDSVQGTYDYGLGWINVYRDDQYMDFYCASNSDGIDPDEINHALNGVAPDYILDNLGGDYYEIGMDDDLINKFIEAVDEDYTVTYNTDNFDIYFYQYEDSVSFYLHGEDGDSYFMINTVDGYLSEISIWQ